ncbi:hypothetical protein GIB67_004356 [Kingdonia uniflora]|uniref:Polygalacturonase n=1 Tax=Kingdonia uniflora TaxID=39325 RepID=A0A7J7MRU1_9MAGN|nr:hypothetical protein GIB67_004356 [Kingdonia uniflora]
MNSFTLSVEGRKNHNKKTRGDKHHGKHVPTPSATPYNLINSRIFNVLNFGAKADGVSDDSKALEAAWKAACKVGYSIIEVPSKFKFLINPISLQGPCMPHLVLQIDGTLLASRNVDSWPKSSLFQWINFKWISNFTIQGSGTVDGQGSAWWNLSDQLQSFQKKSTKYIPEMKPTAMRFYGSYSVTVRDIGIINSPLCHLKFNNCGSVKVNNVTISSPENSPNTDGIHFQNTQDVEIQHSNIGCGDDCVSIQTGCSNIHVHHIHCGPGHGISLGSLGKDKAVAYVKDVVVENTTMQNTQSGVRIKTWQGGKGSVKNVSFSNIKVYNVEIPIIIDQYYCDKKKCKNQTTAVEISGVKYKKIIGTYSVQPVHLACSSNVPCTKVDLIDIQLKPSRESRESRKALCWNTFGESKAPLVPSSIDYCLQKGGGFNHDRLARSHENAC